MKLFIRAHDLGVTGEKEIVQKLCGLGLDGVQLVAYKVLPDARYVQGGVSVSSARKVAETFVSAGKSIPLIGAYFNPVHPDKEKVETGVADRKSVV